MSDDEFRNHSEGIVDKAVAELLVHFDAVQVFVTRVDNKQTIGYARGDGNFYARVGHVNEWLIMQHHKPDPEDE